MPIQPSNVPRTFTGKFDSVQLDFTPEPLEPRERWSRVMANYPTRLAWLHVYLDGADATPSDWVPSAHGFALFAGLLRALPKVRAGQSAIAHWQSDPWQIDLHGDPKRDVVLLTIHLPERSMLLDRVAVPFSQFTQQVIIMCHKWLRYINDVYSDEVRHPKLGEEYKRFEQQLLEAKRAAQ